MASTALTLTELKQIIIDGLQLEGMTPGMIEDDQPLFGDGLGLDSIDALELVVALEKRLGVKIRSDDLGPEPFASAQSLLRYIESRMARAGEPGG